MEIRSLDSVSVAELLDTFLEAFADYATAFGRRQVESMWKTRGVDLRRSFGVFDGDRLVAFVVNGVDLRDGVLTAYDAGTGTIPDYRRKGLVGRMLDEALKKLSDDGVKRYLLEVLCDNAPAVSAYQRAGFTTDRVLVCMRADLADMHRPANHGVDSVAISDAEVNVIDSLDEMIDFKPSWQNDQPSIRRNTDEIKLFAARCDGKIVGVAAVNPQFGDLMTLAVMPEYRCRGIGSMLFDAAVDAISASAIKVLNIDESSDQMIKFFTNKGLSITATQYEMSKLL